MSNVVLTGLPGAPGGTSAAGGAGQNEIATNSGGTLTDSAQANGGAGGAGGSGNGASPNAGVGGAGGVATATDTTSTANSSPADSTAIAIAGSGGDAGSPAPTGQGALGGAGASATATSTDTNTMGGSDTTATAVGGNSGASTKGDGSDGGSAVATGTASGLAATTTVSATAGAGGNATGVGATGGAGGLIGPGTAATATATGATPALSNASASVQATGGAGGSGLQGADGGAGASVTLNNAALGGAEPGQTFAVSEVVQAGAGGTSDTGAGGAAGNGEADLTIVGAGTEDLVSAGPASAKATGGLGGGGTSGAAGGSGIANESLHGGGAVDAVVQAAGGGGGYSFLSAGASGGAATAIGLADTTSTSADSTVNVTALAGAGGAGGAAAAAAGLGANVSADGGAGADVTDASATAMGGGPIVGATVLGAGGAGGASGGTAFGGRGGAIDAISAIATNTGNGVANVALTAIGGAGGDAIMASGGAGGVGGNGASVTLDNNATGSTVGGDLTIFQTADGGRGGNGALGADGSGVAGSGGAAGAAGSATSTLGVNDTTSQIVTLDAIAAGGAGGGADVGNATAGGNAAASATAAGSFQVATTAMATGGAGGAAILGLGAAGGNATADAVAVVSPGVPGGSALANASAFGGAGPTTGGTADATATATALHQATAIADAVGQGGAANASAQTGAAGIGAVLATAGAAAQMPGGTFSTSYAGVTTGVGLQFFANAGQTGAANAPQLGLAYSYAVGAPTTAYVDGIGSPLGATVTQYLGGAGDAVAGLAIMGANYDPRDTTGAAHTYTSTATFDPQGATGTDLLLGLSNYQEYGFDAAPATLQAIELTVTEGTLTLLDDRFTSLSAAETFFTDNVIGFGASPNMPIQVKLAVTASGAGGFGVDLLLGTGDTEPACFAHGTLIATPDGEVAVEDLVIGDRVTTASGSARDITWIGRRSYAAAFAAANPGVRPVLIRAGALADGVPARDLFVSPQHAMLIDGMLIPAIALRNGASIAQADAVGAVHYVHLELSSHDVVLAEGAPAETFVDDDSRGIFHNAHEFAALYPDAVRSAAKFCAPRLEDGEALEAIRLRIAARACGAPAVPSAVTGYVDRVDRAGLTGWAWDAGDPSAHVTLRVLDGEAVIGRVTANAFRPDLVDAGIGDGRRGFTLAFPGGLAPHVPHLIRVVRDSDGAELNGSPWRLDPLPAIATDGAAQGYFDHCTRDVLRGWALDPDRPDEPVALQVLDNGVPIGRILANRHRPDLVASGVGTGRHAFEFAVPGGLSPLARHVISVRRESDGTDLSGSPSVIETAETFDADLEAGISRAVAALAPGDARRANVLSFLAAQADRLLQAQADEDARRAARRGRTPTALRALVIDTAWPAADRDAGSRAILSHIGALRRLGYSVSLAAAATGAPDAATVAALEDRGIACCRVPFYGSVEEVLRRQAGCFDLIYLHRLSSASSYLALARRHHPAASILYGVADLHHLRLARQAAVERRPELLAASRRARIEEGMAALSADVVITHSPVEAAILREMVPDARVHVVPWDVPVNPTRVAFADRTGVAFVGSYHHAPNVDAARVLVEAVMPIVWRTAPWIECVLAGSGMPEAMRRWARPGVVPLGPVQALDDVFARVRLTAAPLRYGAGVKGKVLDSWAAGLPCVMSPVAAEGLSLPHALSATVGADMAGIAAEIVRLHEDEAAHAQAAAAGLATIDGEFGVARVDAALAGAIDWRAAAIQSRNSA